MFDVKFHIWSISISIKFDIMFDLKGAWLWLCLNLEMLPSHDEVKTDSHSKSLLENAQKQWNFFCEIIKEWEFWQFCELFDRTLDSTMALVKVQLLDCRGLMFNKGERGSRGVKIFRLHLGTFIGMVDGLVEQELHHSTKYWASFNEILWEEYSKIY